jgi:hypothetical protein
MTEGRGNVFSSEFGPGYAAKDTNGILNILKLVFNKEF